MKYIIIHTVVLLFSCISNAQTPLDPVMKSYFRENPFEISFSSFITSIQKDPWFSTESLHLRTDTSFFFLTGAYKNFNPFGFKANKVRLTIAEKDFYHTDSQKTLDTMIVIQLIGVLDTSISSTPLVAKEFKKFERKHASDFWRTDHSKDESSKNIKWEINNYYYLSMSLAQLTIAWGRLPDSQEFSFIITVRCKLKENQATFIYSVE